MTAIRDYETVDRQASIVHFRCGAFSSANSSALNAHRVAHLLHTQRDGLQSFFEFSTLLMVSTIWGICFLLKANPNGSNEKSFDTVLPRSMGWQQHRRRL